MSTSNGSHDPNTDHDQRAPDGGASRWIGKKVFTTGEAAEICKVSQQTIIRCFDAGRLQGFRVPGSRFRRIPRDELIRFMQANEIPLDMLDGPSKRILVIDDMLPDINGNIVCQRLKARNDMAGTRIIFVSGVVGEAETQQLLDAGADAFVKKPFRIEELTSRIEELLEA